MWRIQRLAEGEFIVLTVSGRIECEELMNLRDIFAAEAGNKNVVLDLKEVKIVDQETVAFLASCEVSGTKLRNCPAYIREWIGRESTKTYSE
jgi:ABC-type transporter Mla MlaB component